jgi:hypothetical protein
MMNLKSSFSSHFFHIASTLSFLHRLRELENKVLRRIFGSRREERPAGWKKNTQ